jgi:CrcB protein
MISPLLRREVEALLWVAAGAVPGALLRWHWAQGWHGTLLANLLGALVLGGLLPLQRAHPRILLILGVGFCGSLTTFSTWMLELADALGGGQPNQALMVLGGNLMGGLVAVGLGQTLMQRWSRRPKRRTPIS